MALKRARATAADDGEFAAFSCWDGDDSTPWIEEAENYVRGFVLREVEYTFAFRDDDDQLVAVSAFDRRSIVVPPADPVEHPAWQLQIVAITLGLQRQQLCREVFEMTFDAMRAADPKRVLVAAHVHNEHRASRRACEAVGLEYWFPKDDTYTILLGEVPES